MGWRPSFCPGSGWGARSTFLDPYLDLSNGLWREEGTGNMITYLQLQIASLIFAVTCGGP
jgi:hypothetical protein